MVLHKMNFKFFFLSLLLCECYTLRDIVCWDTELSLSVDDVELSLREANWNATSRLDWERESYVRSFYTPYKTSARYCWKILTNSFTYIRRRAHTGLNYFHNNTNDNNSKFAPRFQRPPAALTNIHLYRWPAFYITCISFEAIRFGLWFGFNLCVNLPEFLSSWKRRHRRGVSACARKDCYYTLFELVELYIVAFCFTLWHSLWIS